MSLSSPGRLLVRRPSPALQDGELTHLRRRAVTADRALQEWQAYVEVFATRGWEVHELVPLDEHPDGVFVEDMVVMLGNVAVVTSPAAVTRRGETLSMDKCVAELGLDVRRIELPGTLEGGDVLKVGRTVYVGRSTRTNDEGVGQLAAIAEPMGYTVVPVPVSKSLHLKSALTALPDGTVVGYEPLMDDPGAFPAFVPVPEPEGGPALVLDERTVLISSSAPATAELLRGRGLSVVTTPVSQFERLEGCVTCLSVRVR